MHEKIEIYRQSNYWDVEANSGWHAPVPELCREYGMSSATFYKWRSKYGGIDVSMMVHVSCIFCEIKRYLMLGQAPLDDTINSACFNGFMSIYLCGP